MDSYPLKRAGEREHPAYVRLVFPVNSISVVAQHFLRPREVLRGLTVISLLYPQVGR
jgi:hypothetical protein